MADEKLSQLTTVTPADADLVTGLQSGANSNFTIGSIAARATSNGAASSSALTAHTSNTSNPHNVTIGQVSPLTTRGDVLTRDASTHVRLAIGSTGTFLRSNGTDPSWQLLVAADIPSLDASKITTGTINTARLGTGTADNTTILYGDSVWRTAPSGGVSGSGTSGQLAYWNGASSLTGDSGLTYMPGTLTVESTTSDGWLQVKGKAGSLALVTMYTGGTPRWEFFVGSGNDWGVYNYANGLQPLQFTSSGYCSMGYNASIGDFTFIAAPNGNAWICASGAKCIIGGSSPNVSGTGKLHMVGDTFRLDTARTPSSSADTGNAGEFCWDDSYLYVHMSSGWRRIALGGVF